MRLSIPAGFVHDIPGQGWTISSLDKDEVGFDNILGPVCSKEKAVQQSSLYFPNIYLIETNQNEKYDIFYIDGNKMNEDLHTYPIQKDIENSRALKDLIRCLLKTEKIRNNYNQPS